MITKDTFTLIAMKAYDNPSCKTLVEFEEDISKFSNLVRLCAKEQGAIETYLVLNSVLTLLNIFEPSECIKLMFFKVREEDWYKLKTILVYLGRMPKDIGELGVHDSEIKLCDMMMSILKEA
jgi:hypothetical protein